MRKILLLTIFMVITSGIVFGSEYPYIYKGVRPMGMGGAFVAVSDDANALFYNPAGLARIKNARGSILPLEVEVAKNTVDIYRDALDVDFDDEHETADFLRDYVGEMSHLGISLFPNYSMLRFAFGLVGTARTDLEVRDLQYPKVDAHAINDFGGGFGYAQPLFDDALSIGANLKYIRRQSLNKEYTVLDITTGDFSDKVRDDLVDGSGFLADVGVMVALDRVGLENVRIGVSVNNLIGNDLGDAEDLDDHVDAGFAVDRQLWFTKATFAVDYVDIFSQIDADDDFAKRIRLGVELKFPKVLSLRAGIYQGYFTSGVSLDGRVVQLDFLTYAEEIGSYAGQRDDRRYVLRFVLGF